MVYIQVNKMTDGSRSDLLWMFPIFSGFGGMSIAKSEEEKKTVAGAIIFKEHEKYLKLY